MLHKAGRCYICLRRHHVSRDCRSTMRCSECKGRHHISICLRSTSGVCANSPTSTTMPERARSDTRAPPESTNNMCVNTQALVLLQTAKMPVYNLSLKGSPVIQARAIFDSGSQRTYITSRLSKALSLHPSHTETLYVKTFGSTQGEERNCDVVDLGIITKEEGSLSLSALIVPIICSPLMSQPISYSKEHYDHLRELDLADAAEVEDALEADILIGSDSYWKLVTGRVSRGRNGPLALHSKVGWILSGPVDLPMTSVNLTVTSTHALKIDACSMDQTLDCQLGRFWDLESMGIAREETSVYDKFVQQISFDGQRYEVGLPWKENTHTFRSILSYVASV